MSNDQTIGVVQTSYTVAITFSERPTDEMRQRLKAAGFQFDRGRWFKNQPDSRMATAETVEQVLAA
ncbi:hypothetical protein [Paludisphaera sp.]|uniref:hypothetical protein n=1 Tax=Paludisphaera sp. TaxID=2017432 RepID=UPI00301DA9AC